MSTSCDRVPVSPEQRYQPTTGMLLRLLAEGAQRRARLIEATGRPESAVAQALTTLKHRGLVTRLRYGLWTLTDAGREHVHRSASDQEEVTGDTETKQVSLVENG